MVDILFSSADFEADDLTHLREIALFQRLDAKIIADGLVIFNIPEDELESLTSYFADQAAQYGWDKFSQALADLKKQIALYYELHPPK